MLPSRPCLLVATLFLAATPVRATGGAQPAEEAARFDEAIQAVRTQWQQQYPDGNIPPKVLSTFFATQGISMETALDFYEGRLRDMVFPDIRNGRRGAPGNHTQPVINLPIPGRAGQPVLPSHVFGPGGVKLPAMGSEIVNILTMAQPDSGRARATSGYYKLATGDNLGSARDFQWAMQNGYATPEVATGLGQAAYNVKDYELARTAAALALKMQAVRRTGLGGAYPEPPDRSRRRVARGRPGAPGLARGRPAGQPRGLLHQQGVAAPLQGGEVVVAGNTPGGLKTAQAPAAPSGLTPVQASAAATENARHALVLKDYPLAVVHATKAIEYNAENAQALNYRAIAYNRMQKYADAVNDASASLSLAPGNAAALQTRSWAFAQQKQYREALQDAESTLGVDPQNAYAYQNKAFALAGLGDRAGALDALRMSATLDARFKGQYERALQLPQDQDLTLLFEEKPASAAAAAPRPASTPRRFARMALLSATGGLLIALGILHVVSASWREKVRMTVRRVLASSDAAVAEAPGATPHPGSSAFWTQYDLVKEIGMGGMGVVYEAKDRSLERRVAVKKMRDEIRIDPHEKQRFINEAKTVAQLRHPNIVDIYSIVEDGSDVYLVFEYVEGHTLHDRLRSQGAYAFGEALKVFRDVSGAVDHAHAAKIVHRDLKPSNVMVTTDGRVKVMDFGVARQAKDALTKVSMTNTVVGTPPYMAPEQEQGTVRKESDVYALAVCFYEMVTGQLPFTGAGSGMLLNKINGKHIPPTQRVPSLPAKLDAVMARALHPDPEKRHHTAAELLADLEKLA